MSAKAGEVFVCAICGDPHPERDAHWNEELNAPVDEECKKLYMKAGAWLKHIDKNFEAIVKGITKKEDNGETT